MNRERIVGSLALVLALVTGPAGAARAADMTLSQAGAHASHTQASPAHAKLPCAECHAPVCSSTGTNLIFGPLAGARGAAPSWNPTARSCSNVYCHGNNTTPISWTWTDPSVVKPPSVECAQCHGYPPVAPHPQDTACHSCHDGTVLADGTVDLAGGKHINGQIDFSGGATPGQASGFDCGLCHGYPPPSGAHAAHFDLQGVSASGAYGDTRILQDLYPSATPATAGTAYAFGCGNCHPLDPAHHLDGTVDVEVRNVAAPAGSLKAKATAAAAYDPATKTCSGTYCHSTGQATPTYKTSAGWTAGPVAPEARCSQCHDDPPSYTGGNSHAGHVLGMPGVSHNYPNISQGSTVLGSQHGQPTAYDNAKSPERGPWDTTPMTCQTCHFDTVDPRNTTLGPDGSPTGYYYLDTGGSKAALCVGCHHAGGKPTGTGKTLPLRHVNGSRDVRFDPRSGTNDGPAGQSVSDLSWIPEVPGTPYVGARKPPKPYWITNAYLVNWGCRPGGQVWYPSTYGGTAYCPPGAVWQPNWYYRDMFTDPATATYCRNYPADCSPPGWVQSWGYATISFSLDVAVYDPQKKTCSSVGCHLGSWSYPMNVPTWGVRARNCFPCHRN